jgi:hypothetical protein
MTAIDQGNPILVLKLLEAGAKPEIDFDSWLQGAKFSFESQLGVSDFLCKAPSQFLPLLLDATVRALGFKFLSTGIGRHWPWSVDL